MAAYLPYFIRAAEYAAIPLIIVLAITLYFDRPKTGVWYSIWLFLSFSFATGSVVLAVSSIMYAKTIGGFPYYDPLLLSIFRWGLMLSLGAIIFSIAALWRPSALRWAALGCSIVMLLFWFWGAIGE
jgi:hypothetical protein